MEIEIRSVSEYVEKCLSSPILEKEDLQVFYRGTPQIYRDTVHIPGIYYLKNYIKDEDKIFREMLSFFPEEMLTLKSTVERLIFMQHYRIPTRIMDISRNPLIGLFFACFADVDKESSKKAGIVYLYTVPKGKIKYCDSDAVSIIANICKCPYDFSVRDIYHLERDEFNNEERIQHLIHEIGEEKPYFHPVVEKENINSVVCLRPRMNNPRIIRQDGYFFLFGIDYDKKNCAKLDPDWIQDRKFIIPHEAKKKILHELDALNINEAFVYPDYEHVSNVIRKRIEESTG
jgi:hypothetical protein